MTPRRINGRFHCLLICSAALAVTFIAPSDAQQRDGQQGQTDKQKVLAYDGFEGETSLNWQPVRHDPTHVSLDKHPGYLTITTQQGSIHRDEKSRGEPSAKNLYLIDNPAKDGDFTVTTSVRSFKPTMPFQQVGLLCYNDDDNYLKFCYQFDWGTGRGYAFSLLVENDGVSQFEHLDGPDDAEQVWLRLTKLGNDYQLATSTDGKKFTVHGEATWEGQPEKLGFYAKNGGRPGVPEIEALFDFFEVRTAEEARP